MKRILSSLIILAALTVPLASAAQQSGTDKNILTSWTQPPQTGGAPWPFCSSVVTKACIWGYVETLADPTGHVNTVPACSASLISNCIGPVTTYTWTPGGNLYCGTWTITLATSYLDGNGTAGISAPSGAVSTTEPCPFVPPASPSTVSAKPTP